MNLQDIATAWMGCERCGLSKFRHSIVIGDGSVPAEIMLIGEGPGKSEDLIGKPFIGQSGHLLREALRAVAERLGEQVPSIFITNTVACRPTSSPEGDNRQPTRDEIWACGARVRDLFKVIQPVIVVTVGKVSEQHYKRAFPHTIKIMHPAYVLRDRTQYIKFEREIELVFKFYKEVKNGLQNY